MPTRSGLALPASLIVLLLTCTAHAQCAEDVSDNGVVDVADILRVIGAWGQCQGECPEDVNGDGVVDVADLVRVLAAWGPCRFEYTGYENEFAELVGIEYVGRNGPLLLDEAIYDRVARDMRLIEKDWPELVGGAHFGDWVPYHLIVGVDLEVPRDELDALAEYYDATITNEWFSGAILLLDFPHPVNVPALVPMFEALVPVEYAEGDGYAGLPGGGTTPGWFIEDVGQGAAEWTVVVPWREGRICDWNGQGQRCLCWSRHTFLTLPDGTVALRDIESGCYLPCEEDCSVYP